MSEASNKAVFLSYASQDAEAAKKICEALRQAGVEVWFDQSELVGGDAWDQKIRKQIRECALFVPILSRTTQSRREAYFRLEWRLADERTHLMAKGTPFLLPVTIDETNDRDALVPDAFLAVQWSKLPGGETTPTFCARVKKLLAGDVGRESPPPPSSEAAGSDGPAPRKNSSGPRWLRPILASGAIVIAVLAFTLIKRPPHETVAPTVAATPEKLSPARQLVRRARPLIEEVNRVRADYDTAENLLEQAAKLDPNDAQVWAEWAVLDSAYLDSYFDRSAARKTAAQTHAARAMGLDPGSRDARFARAKVLLPVSDYSPAAAAEAVEILRPLVAENPRDAEAVIFLAYALSSGNRPDEALAVFDRAALLPGMAARAAGGRTWVYFMAGRYADAERAVDVSLASDQSWEELSMKVNLELTWRGNLDEAARLEAELPTSWRLESFGATIAWWVYSYRREPEKALAVLRMVLPDYLESQAFNGPKGLLVGDLLEMGGHTDAARVEWGQALKVVEQRLASAPNNQVFLEAKIALLDRLGERAEAERLWRLDLELYGGNLVAGGRLYLMVRMEPPDRALDLLDGLIRGPLGWNIPTAAMLRYDPMFDPLRKSPRFAELLTRAEADPRLSPNAKEKSPEKATPPDQKSVAVLAFANLSDDKGNEYFSDGISEELLNVLAKIPGLKVTARTSAFYFKDKNIPVSEIGRQLGVAYVVEGSVRKAGSRVRISAQLVKAADGFQEWSDDFDRELKDVFAVQDEIAGLIAKNLQLKLGDTAKIVATVDPEAYRLYLEGRQALQRRTTEAYGHAEILFQQAKAIAPDWAPVYAALADTARLRAWGGETGPTGPDSPWNADMKDAKALAEHALQLDPGLADAYVSLAGIHMIAWQKAEGGRFIRRALELNPNSADAYLVLGRIASADGRLDDSIAALRRAADLNPLAPRILDNLAAELGFAGQLNESWTVIERATALQPDSSQIQCYRARVLTALGRREEALAQAGRLIDNTSEEERDFRLLEASRVYAVFGQQAKAEETIAGMRPGTAESVIACGYVRHPERALPILHQINFGWIEDLIWGRDFDPIRNDPQFVAYLKSTGLLEAQERATAWRAAQDTPSAAGKRP